jgi:hypothetical protein
MQIEQRQEEIDEDDLDTHLRYLDNLSAIDFLSRSEFTTYVCLLKKGDLSTSEEVAHLELNALASKSQWHLAQAILCCETEKSLTNDPIQLEEIRVLKRVVNFRVNELEYGKNHTFWMHTKTDEAWKEYRNTITYLLAVDPTILN